MKANSGNKSQDQTWINLKGLKLFEFGAKILQECLVQTKLVLFQMFSKIKMRLVVSGHRETSIGKKTKGYLSYEMYHAVKKHTDCMLQYEPYGIPIYRI